MAFGQPAGPPATHRQLEELTALLVAAGHTGYRDARGPMGFTQRQSGGRFTRDEADAYIERLRGDRAGEADALTDPAHPAPDPVERPAGAARPPRVARTIRDVPTDQLAAELRRRGWRVEEPDPPGGAGPGPGGAGRVRARRTDG
jgi:hypothetical protein